MACHRPRREYESMKSLGLLPRTRLGQALVFFPLFAAIVIAAVYNYRAIDRELTESALSRRAALSYLTAAVLAEKFNRLADIGIALAARARFRQLGQSGNWAQAINIPGSVPADFPFIDRITLNDPGGTLMADIPPAPEIKGQNFAHRDWYQAVMRTGQPSISAFYGRAAPPQMNVFVAAVPITSSKGEMLGFVIVQVRLDRFFGWIAGIDAGPGGLVYVTDRLGVIASHPKFPPQGDLVDYSSAPAVQRILQGKRGVETIFDSVDKSEHVVAYEPIAKHGWGVVLEQPAATVFALRDEQLRLILFAYGLILFLMLSAAYLALRFAAQRMQAEEDDRVKARFLQTTQVLEAEVAERKYAQNELAKYAERLNILHEIDQSIMAVEEPEAIAEAALQRLQKLIAVPRATVNLFDLEADEAEWLAAVGRRRVHRGPGVRFSMQLMGDIQGLRRGGMQVVDTAALPPGPAVDALLASRGAEHMAVPMITRRGT